jgi:hypothetical protein
MTRLMRRITLGQIFPGRAGTKYPKDPVQNVSRIAPRSTTAILTDPRLREHRCNHRPLRFGQVHHSPSAPRRLRFAQPKHRHQFAPSFPFMRWLLVSTHQIQPQFPFVNTRRWDNVLSRSGEGIVLLLTTNLDPRVECSTTTALVWNDVRVDSSAVLNTWCDLSYMNSGERFVASRRLFPTRMVFAVSADGRYAYADGMSYCINVKQIQSASGVNRICRHRTAVPLSGRIRDETFDALPTDEERKRILRSTLADQAIPDHLPAFDHLLFDHNGRLWVRTLTEEFARVHPLIMEHVPGHAPEYRRWDVFGRAGAFIRTVELPAAFTPQVTAHDKMYGVLELSSGELVVVSVRLPHLQELLPESAAYN